MNCDCVKIINEKLKKATGDNEAEIVVNVSLTMEGVEMFVPAWADYREKKANGELKAKSSRNMIIAGFCPFCGKRMKKEKEELAPVVTD